MDDAAEVGRRKRRSNRAVVAGCSLMTVALLLSGAEVGPHLATTLGAVVGLVLLLYGVHIGWLLFYDRDPDGPSS